MQSLEVSLKWLYNSISASRMVAVLQDEWVLCLVNSDIAAQFDACIIHQVVKQLQKAPLASSSLLLCIGAHSCEA